VPLTKQSTTVTSKTMNGPKRSRSVTYGVLSRALVFLGYRKLPATGSHVVFVHPKSKARLFLPWRSDSKNVDLARLTGIYQQVASGGVASRDTIKNALAKSMTRGTPRRSAKAGSATAIMDRSNGR
jgi:predicted RNA binding protein YcfA (HicA-like mRNA interferase family)